MIFVTVGSQEPFDRLVKTVDEWAGRRGVVDIFAQIGRTPWRPRHLEWVTQLSPDEFLVRAKAASIIVSHAGMGTILTAFELGKPILVMPRRAALRETRNDHQFATAEKLATRGLEVAQDEEILQDRLDHLSALQAPPPVSPYASQSLLTALRDFIGEPTV